MAVRKRLRGGKLHNGPRNGPLDGRDQAEAVHMSTVVDGSAVLMLRAVRMWAGLRAAVLVSVVATRPHITVGRGCSHCLVMYRAVVREARRAFHGQAQRHDHQQGADGTAR